MSILKKVGSWVMKGIHKLTFMVSKATTAIVLTFGALAGINHPERLYIALMAFTIGLPVGFILFGQAFNMLTWLLIVTGLLFMMNLNNMWEVIIALGAGGLDFQMVKDAVTSVSSVTPSPKDITRLNHRIEEMNANVQHMNTHHDGYEGSVFQPLMDLPLLKPA